MIAPKWYPGPPVLSRANASLARLELMLGVVVISDRWETAVSLQLALWCVAGIAARAPLLPTRCQVSFLASNNAVRTYWPHDNDRPGGFIVGRPEKGRQPPSLWTGLDRRCLALGPSRPDHRWYCGDGLRNSSTVPYRTVALP